MSGDIVLGEESFYRKDGGTWWYRNPPVCEVDETLRAALDEIERLRAALGKAAGELEAEHQPAADVKGRWCIICGPADGSWPCVSKMVADEIEEAFGLEGEANE